MGGQAGEMRGEPNAIGIPTKKAPGMGPNDFFSDFEYAFNVAAIDRAFTTLQELAERNNFRFKAIIIPLDGLGTGLAELDKRAPRTFEYLQDKLAKL